MPTTPRLFQLTDVDVTAFAEASGDHNPLHVDPDYARHTPFGRPVAHGALCVLRALAAAPSTNGRTATHLEATFHSPVFTGQDYTLTVTDGPGGEQASIAVHDGTHPVLDLAVGYGSVPATSSAAPPLLTGTETDRRADAARLSLADLTPQRIPTTFGQDEPGYRRLLSRLGLVRGQCTVGLATLLGWASYLAGMHAPGRDALVLRIAVDLTALRQPGAYEPDTAAAPAPAVHAEVTEVDQRFGRVELRGKVDGAELAGAVQVAALVRGQPDAPHPDRVAAALGDDRPLAGKVAVVVGASRGLGAAITQALSLAGATVYAGFQRSRADAEAVRTGLGTAGERVHLRQGDWSDPAWCRQVRDEILTAHGGVDIVVLSACPPVNLLRLEEATDDRAARYLARSTALIRAPLAAFAEPVANRRGQAVAISSAWVVQPPPGRSHYVTAKYAVEGLLRAAAVEFPSAGYLVARPPTLETTLSGGLSTTGAASRPEPVAAAIVRKLAHGLSAGQVLVQEDFPEPGPAGRTPTPSPVTSSEPASPTLAIAATFTADPIRPVVTSWAERLGLDVAVTLADYNQVFQQLLDPTSRFRNNPRGCNAALVRLHDWLAEGQDLDRTVADFIAAVQTYTAHASAPLLVVLCPPPPTAVAARGDTYASAERAIAQATAGLPGVHLISGEAWRGPYPYADHHDAAREMHAHIPYDDTAFALLGTTLMRAVHALLAPPFKVLVLDCDNTLWQGVCGEDGPAGVSLTDGHRRLQRWAADLRERGILLCLASKNHEADVAETLQRHDMPLSWDHLTTWRVDWNAKADNLQAIAEELNVGLDSVVFIDDNPVEVAAVRAAHPQVLSLRLPTEPAAIPGFVDRLWAFDQLAVTSEDRVRAATYRANRDREQARHQSLTFADFITSLGLAIDVREAGDGDLTRVAQLTQRTNQFNTSGVRRTEAEIRALTRGDRPDHRCWVVDVRDRFGDYGTVGAALTRRDGSATVVDTFLLSCRVLGRGVEHAFLAHLGRLAHRDGDDTLDVPYVPTARNTPARAFLEKVTSADAASDGPVVFRIPSAQAAAVTFQPGEEPAAAPASTEARPAPPTSPRHAARQAALSALATALTDAERLQRYLTGAAGLEAAAPADGHAGTRAAVDAAVREVVAHTLHRDPAELVGDVAFETLRMSSLDAVNVTVALERRLGRTLPTTLMFEHRSLERLIETLCAADSPPVRRPDTISVRPTTAGTAPPGATAPAAAGAADIAVVGLAGRYPGADDPDQLWQLLASGSDAVRELTQERWDHRRYLDPGGGPASTYSAWAALVDAVDEFDAAFFGIAPREAELMDPQQRLFLQTAYAAVQDAGHTRTSLGPNVGVYAGVMANDYAALTREASLTGRSPYPYAENYQIANRVSYFFDFAGPSLAVDTACSSSAVAVHLACEAIRCGQVSAAIAGGVNLILHPSRHIQYAQMGMLSRDGRCRAFGAGADGFVMGEGVGAVLLRPLDAALRDGDTIYGVIKATATNSGGRTSGFTVPNPEAQAELVARALTTARIDPRTVTYIEAHGSGTELGDPIEIRGLTAAFARAAVTPGPVRPGWCAIGSVKSAIGHLESGAGIAGLTKVLLQLRHQTLLPTLHADTLNPHIAFDDTPFRVQRELAPWRAPAVDAPDGPEPRRRAGVSSFGAGGVNAHLVVEEAPAVTVADDPRQPELVLLSAGSDERLRLSARRLLAHLEGPGRRYRLADVAYVLRVGRDALAHRAAFVATNREQLLAGLRAIATANATADTPTIVRGTAGAKAALAGVFDGDADSTALLTSLAAKGQLGRLGQLWTHGADLSAPAILPTEGRRRVPLPTYPFESHRHWLPTNPDTPSPAAPGARPDDTPGPGPGYYHESWQPAVDVPAATAAIPTIVLGLDDRPHPPHIRVCASEDEALRRLRDLDARRVLVVDTRRLHERPELAAELHFAARVAATCRPGTATTLVSVGRPARVDPWGAAISAFTRSAAQEVPGFDGVRIEVGDDVPLPVDLTRIAAEATSGEPEIHLRADRRLTRRLVPSIPAPAAPAWRNGGVYLITGGAGGIGRAVAEHLCTRHGAAVALIGRRPADARIQELLRRLGDGGGRALYFTADVTNRTSLAAAVHAVTDRLGTVNGVLHAAGVIEDRLLMAKTPDSIARVLDPKVTGTVLLDEVTADLPLDFFCLTSSVVGTVGGPGQADYAAANRFLDAFVSWRDDRARAGQRHGDSIAIAWPHWRDGGMAASAEALELAAATTGLRTMSTQDGLAALDLLMSTPGWTLVAVGDQARIRASLDRLAAAPAATAVAHQPERLRERITDIAARLLKTPADQIDPEAELGGYGFNSVLLTQLAAALSTSFGVVVTPVLLFQHPTVNAIAGALASLGPQRTVVQAPMLPAPAITPPEPATTLPARSGGPDLPTDPLSTTPIAVVGMAGRFPGAPNLRVFWDNLMRGRDLVSEVDPARWDWRTVGPAARFGGFLEDVDGFDAAFFGISPREAQSMDPQQRMFLEACWAAIEHSGYHPRSWSGSRTGVFAGVTLHDYLDVLQRADQAGAAHAITGNVHSIVPNRVSYLLNLRGPSESVDAACASSLVAVHRAVAALRSGECEAALAGGVNALLSERPYTSLSVAGMLSPTGRCHTFGDAADGYVRGEGIGVVVLKTLERAQADGDTIHGLILGSAVNHGGRAHSLTAPNPRAQSEVIVDAVRNAGVPASTITYIETHGTGTRLGDPVEISGLQDAFTRLEAPDGLRCSLGAVKSAVGHLESAAGIVSLLKVLLAMRHRTLPANLHGTPPNPHLDLTDGRFQLCDTTRPWLPPTAADGRSTPLRAGVSSFGFGGTNAHIVVQEPPHSASDDAPDGGWHPVTLSARDDERLREYTRLLHEHLTDLPEADLPSLADLAYTAQMSRSSMPARLAIVVTSVAALRERLGEYLAGRPADGVLHSRGDTPPTPTPVHAEAHRWVTGEDVDWAARHHGQRRRRVPLPTYPFDHRDTHRPAAVARQLRPASHMRDDDAYDEAVLLRHEWVPAPVSTPNGGATRRTCLLMVRDHTALGTLGALPPGTDWIVLRERSALPRLLRHEYEMDLDDHGEGRRAAARIVEDHPRLDAILDLTDVLDGTADASHQPGREGARIGALQAFVAATAQLRIVHLTRGLTPWRNPRPGMAGARMAAVVRAVGAEHAAVSTTTVDVPVDATAAEALTVGLDLLAGGHDEPHLTIRDGQRYRPVLVDQPIAPATGRPGHLGTLAVHPDRTYLITGGTGGLGAALARDLFDRGARRFAILGRRPVPAPDRWGGSDGGPNGLSDLRYLHERGADLAIHHGSLTDRSTLASFLAKVRQRAAIAGVVHCAGTVTAHHRAFVHKPWDDFTTTWEPKGDGLLTLDELLADDEPDFVVLYSSLSAAVPGLAVGLSDYASANAFLDHFAARAAARAGGRTRYLSVQWGSWSGGGMGEVRTPRYAEHGFAPMTPAQGLALLDAALASHDTPPVVAAARRGSVAPSAPSPAPAPPTPAPAPAAVVDLVRELVAAEVMVPVDKVAAEAPFSDLGVDSILLAGMVVKLEELTGTAITPSAILEHPSARALAEYLVQEHSFRPPRPEPESTPPAPATVSPAAPPARRASGSGAASAGRHEAVHRTPLAVVGMASRFPGAPTTADFWTLLRDGRSAITQVPPDRWDVDRLYRPTLRPGISTSKWGGFLDRIEEFDPAYFGIAEDDAAHVDPVIRLVLEAADQTFRDAGYERGELSGRRVAVFAGAATSTYGSRITTPRPATVTGLNPNMIGAHVAHVYDLRGPNMVVDTACSSALSSLYLAQQALRLGDCDLALVAAADLLLDETPYLKLSAAQALSPDGACRVFDQRANGIVLGEGAGAVLLKRLADAVADGDQIHAVVESVAVNNDGRTMGLTTPNPQAQEEVIAAALRAAEVEPGTVSYLEAHGTGTMIGDPMELRALTRVFRQTTDDVRFCAVGSVKSNIGHLLMAAGMAGLHKAILSIRHRQLPPTLHCDTPNPRFAFDTSPFYPNTELSDWAPRTGLRRLGISAFGFGGTNCHAILREPIGPELRPATRTCLPPAAFRRARHWLERQPPRHVAARPHRYLELVEPETPALQGVTNGAAPARRSLLALEELS